MTCSKKLTAAGIPAFAPIPLSSAIPTGEFLPPRMILRIAASRSPGPVDRKMIINAMNSGANVFMADFEDSNSPGWDNVMGGQINLRDAINQTISYTNPENGKKYSLNEKTATLFVRPRGWHLEEKHILIDGEPISASLFDFGLYFFHNAKTLLKKRLRPLLLLTKDRKL